MHSEELTNLVMELVSRPSCWNNGEDQRRLGEYIHEWFEKGRITAELDEFGNVVVNPGASVVLNGHIDVVQPAGQANFQPVINGDAIVGRGTADMKGGVAVAMVIMRELHKEYPQLGAVFQVTEESEYEQSGVDILCERGVFDRARFILEAEPSGDSTTGNARVFFGSEGGFDWLTEIVTDESSYHAANMHRANNAILAAITFVNGLINDRDMAVPLDEFKRSYDAHGTRSGKGPINVAKIEGGTQPTWTPNRCALEFEKRLYPTEKWTTFLRQLNEYSNSVSRAVSARIRLQPLWHADPFMLDSESDGYRFIERWAKGHELVLAISNGASDLNKIYNHLLSKGRKITGVHFGPGFLDIAHRSDEYVLISDLNRFYEYYLSLMRELFEGEGQSLIR